MTRAGPGAAGLLAALALAACGVKAPPRPPGAPERPPAQATIGPAPTATPASTSPSGPAPERRP